MQTNLATVQAIYDAFRQGNVLMKILLVSGRSYFDTARNEQLFN